MQPLNAIGDYQKEPYDAVSIRRSSLMYFHNSSELRRVKKQAGLTGTASS